MTDFQKNHSATEPRQAPKAPTGPEGDKPPTQPAKQEVQSHTPENADGRINPSSPEDANITPGSAGDK